MAQLSLGFFQSSTISNGWFITIIGVVVCYVLLDLMKVNAIILILAALVLGGIFLG